MTDEEFEGFLVGCSDDQVNSLRGLRSLIDQNSAGLDEGVNTGRWLNGYVFYSAHGQMIYAIGPKGKSKTTLHMMPYYGSPVLQERHGEALSTFLSGKSCIAFHGYSELPLDALTDIICRGTQVMIRMLEELARAERARRSTHPKEPD